MCIRDRSTLGQPVVINAGCIPRFAFAASQTGPAPGCTLEIWRDSTQLSSLSFIYSAVSNSVSYTEDHPANTVPVVDTPAAGTYIYYLKCTGQSGTKGNMLFVYAGATIFVLGIKK